MSALRVPLHYCCKCMSKQKVCDDAGCWGRGWGGRKEGGRETLQSALPPSVWEAAAAAAAALRRSSGGSGSCTLQPGNDVSNRTGGNFPSSRDGLPHHGRLLLPAGDTEDAPEPGNELLLGLKWACEEFWVKFFCFFSGAGGVNGAVAPAVAAAAAGGGV